MQKIASPQHLQAELARLIHYCESESPSRTLLAAEIGRLASETQGTRTAKMSLSGIKPLYGYDSPQNAYLVEDYPYGFQARTQIRYWLEQKGKRGWRLISQTMNPKTNRWNKPKASTYMEWAGAMYLDNQDHVKWIGLGRYSDVDDFLEFVKNFPKADLNMVKAVTKAKIKMLEQFIDGSAYWTINKVKTETTDADRERYEDELKTWHKVEKAL